MTRIAIRDSTDSYNIGFFDNTNGIKYHTADLEVYAQGSAFLDLKYYSKTQIVDVGMRLAFVFRNKDYWMTVTSVSRESEYEYQVEARSLSLEALREVRSSYKASRNMTFKEYIDVFDPEHSIRLNVNTIADRSRKLEWTGEDTILARILSLATKFDAEIEFETELNDDYSLKEFRLNVHALNELGKDRTGIPFRISNSQLKLIKFKSSIDEFYSAIRGTGKDGLSISGLDKKVYDDEKKLLFYTSGGTIYAPQARDKFISITNKKTSDGYIVREFDSTEHETKEALYAYMLGELKKHCEPQIDYTIDGYIDADVNDKVLLIDDKYTTDDLMLTARVNKQKWSLIDKLQGNNRTELSNYVRVYSEIADELITRMNALIEANKVYDVQILTTNGYSFKNGFGETTLTARVMDGPKDVTNEFSLTWFKNSTEYADTASINVQAGSIDELATYLIIAEKDGRERGRNELTVFNVKDGQPGKTPVVHLAWADSADGTVKFTTELPTDWIPKYRGYYVDYSSVASTNPKLYKWERNPDDAAKVADEAKNKADSANSKADSAVDVANTAKDTADEASKQTALVNELANTAKELADKANADATEANRLIGLANTEIGKLNTNVDNVKSDLASAETDLASKIETVKTTLTQNYATKTNLSDTQISLTKIINESVASVKQEMSETYAVKSDLTTLNGDYTSFKEDTAKKFSQQVSSIQTIQTDTTNAKQLANDALSKAQNAVTSATNASSTASSALSKASDATSVANSASQNASNAVASANTAVSTANTAKTNADKAIADVASLTKTVSSQSTRIDQTSSRIDQVASGVTEVGDRLDNLQVGGRNLALNSGREVMNKDYRLSYYYISPSEGGPLPNGYGYLVDRKKYTIVICLTTDSTINEICPFLSSGFQFLGAISLEKNKKQVVSLDFTARYYGGRYPSDYADYARLELYRYPNPTSISGAQYVTVHWVKIVDASGVVVKDWGPAPEDQQSQIDGINNNLSNNYYQKTVVDSKISTATSGITAQYTSDINTKLANYYDKSTMDRKLTIDGQGIETYVKDTKSQLNNLSIGADNLIINGGNITEISPWQPRYKDKFGIYKHPFYYNGEKNIFRLDTTSTTDENYVNSNRFEVKRNTDYTLSFIGFYNGNIRSAEVIFLGRKSTETNVQYSYVKSMPLVLSNGKAVYKTITFNSGDNDNGYIRIDNNGTLSEGNLSTLYFGEVMLVEGTVARKYQPSSAEFPTLTQYTQVKQLADRISSTVYDSASGLVTKTTQLANSYAIKQLNSSGDILTSLNLNANTSTAEINAKLIRLNGYTKMDDSFINNLVANSILTNKIKATEISGDYIKGGTIQGVKIISNNGPGNVTLNYGRIDMDLIEPIEPNVNRNSIGTFTPSYVTMASYIDRGSTPQLDGSVMLDYAGFTSRIKDDDGTIQDRRIEFNSEGFHIYPIDASSNALNSGIILYGKYAYLDLNGNKTTKVNGTVSRIVSNPDGNMQIINNDGNIYLNTKHGEQPIANGYKLIYTWGSPNDMSVRHIKMVNSSSSSPYAEIQNNAGTAFGMNVWKSDQRLKSNIQSPTKDALTTINQLQVRQFDWKSDNVHEDFGLIAQEVEQILPNAVFKVGDYYQIKDSGLIPVLIGAVQKLSNKVNLLENIIYNTKGSNLL